MRRYSLWLSAVLAVGCGPSGARPVTKAPVAVVRPDATTASRGHERALALLNEGDALLKVSVDGAIEKYQQALELEPGNLDGLWKLACAQEKKEEWAAVDVTLERALRVAPKAEFLRERARALVELAHDGDTTAYERARALLERCLQIDAKSGDCASLLGEVEVAADHLQLAAERYTRAVQLDPQQMRNYVLLAGIYRIFKQPQQAEMVLAEGLRRAPVNDRTRGELAAMALGAARYAATRNDASAAQSWLEQAEALSDGAAPELLFQLGSMYASTVLEGAGPRDSAKALRVLNLFIKRVCRGAAATKYQQQCWVSESMVQRLAYLDTVTPPAKSEGVKPAVPVALPSGMPVPQLQMQPVRVGDAYTVWGAGYLFRSGKLPSIATKEPVAITGYIVKTNLGQAARCAVHRSGIADPENCRADIPAFWLGDRADAAEADCIKVMGFASNFAQLFEAIRQANSAKPERPYVDEYWGQVIPNPLPVAGAKVTVRGHYGPSFAKASSGAEMDLTMGLLDYVERDVLEPGPDLATLPGVKRRKR
ncbi:MAG: hypothetical protein ABUL60_10425 [Myxococcales bacterium]